MILIRFLPRRAFARTSICEISSEEPFVRVAVVNSLQSLHRALENCILASSTVFAVGISVLATNVNVMLDKCVRDVVRYARNAVTCADRTRVSVVIK